jgi:alpha-glucoside transport system substrate-binding protein
MQLPKRAGAKAAALLLVPAMFLAACGSDDDDNASSGSDDLKGKVVTVFGPEVDTENASFLAAVKPLEDRTGIDVQYQGDKSFEQQIGSRVDGGNPPDIALFPQPGKVADFKSDLKPVADDTKSIVEKNFDSGWSDRVTMDGKLYGIPVKADLKSLIWYSPKFFKQNNYAVPTTYDDWLKLSDKMIADGKAPFCLGLGSDAATGWPATDWVEDIMLRTKGPDVYDKWVSHEIAFDSKDVVDSGQAVKNIWSKPGAIYGGEKPAASVPFQDAGLPVLEGKCMMYKMANFYQASWPAGTKLGADGDVNTFFLPGNPTYGNTTLTGGLYASAFADRPEVKEVMKYLAGTEYSDTRAPTGAFLSPNKNANATLYKTEIEQNFAKILKDADPVRFDASDLMPGAVGSGTFWTAEVDITTGAKSVADAYKSVEASWPKS